MTEATLTWWSILLGVSALNIVAWTVSASVLRGRLARLRPGAKLALKLQMLLSAAYVLGCAYRSVFPVFDVQRLCMFDSWLSSVIVGRSVATIAELCFAAQWALLLRSVALGYDHRAGVRLSRLVLPMIGVAEICSWYAVLTTSNIGHVLEESLWGACAALMVVSCLMLYSRCERALRPALLAAGVLGLGYVIYMFEVDVPMYWSRWVFDEGHGRRYLSIAQGLADVSGRWTVSHRWTDWQSEVIWMTLYFSVAVWLSIALMHMAYALGSRRMPAQPKPDRARPAMAAAWPGHSSLS